MTKNEKILYALSHGATTITNLLTEKLNNLSANWEITTSPFLFDKNRKRRTNSGPFFVI